MNTVLTAARGSGSQKLELEVLDKYSSSLGSLPERGALQPDFRSSKTENHESCDMGVGYGGGEMVMSYS